MTFKVIRDSNNAVVAFGPDNEHYQPQMRDGDTITIESASPDGEMFEYNAWQAEMVAFDVEGVTRPIEDLMDAMIGAGITISAHLMSIHGRKKAKRNKKPT